MSGICPRRRQAATGNDHSFPLCGSPGLANCEIGLLQMTPPMKYAKLTSLEDTRTLFVLLAFCLSLSDTRLEVSSYLETVSNPCSFLYFLSLFFSMLCFIFFFFLKSEVFAVGDKAIVLFDICVRRNNAQEREKGVVTPDKVLWM